jgi:nucleoside-diphosphate-sugar epimerase
MKNIFLTGATGVLGKGNYFWNYIHVDDATRAVVYALRRFKALKNRTVNFTDFEPVRAKTALDVVARLTNSKSPYQMPVFLSRMDPLKRFV